MKKLLTFISVVALAGAVNSASAMDRTGNFGLGFQESFSGDTFSTTLGSWSAKYGFTSNLTGQFMFGFDMFTKNWNDKKMNVAGGILYDLVENENSDFYTGLRFGCLLNAQDNVDGADQTMLRIGVPLGFEWSFTGLPEVGFSAEAGFVWDYRLSDNASRVSSVGGNIGGSLGLGVHYYF
jgi:hypothetical protein